MKNIVKLVLPILMCGVMAVSGLTFVESANASSMTIQEAVNSIQPEGYPTDLFGPEGVFRNITNTVLYIVGIVAVIMLIIGGIKYVVSGGDAKKVTDAKNTVLYAIIGLIVCFLAFAIVNFVIVTALPSKAGSEASLLLESAYC